MNWTQPSRLYRQKEQTEREGWQVAILGKIELAHEPDFAIGALIVSPSRRELARPGGVREILEHRVMQVLVALARAQESIVTREELTQLCWEGRIVGEDAINRVISRLRKSAAGIGAGVFRIETLSKIGYRLVVDDPGAAPDEGNASTASTSQAIETLADKKAGPGRRTFLAGAASAAGLAAAGIWLYRGRQHPELPLEIQELMAQADHLRAQNSRDGQYQAIGLHRRVVELAPDYADGWGMLAFSYAVPSHFRDRIEAEALRERAEAAAHRALGMDPGNAYGELALAVALPFIGYWKQRDYHIKRALADRPDDYQVLLTRAVNLQFVGRSSEAVSCYKRIRSRPLTPSAYKNYIDALWSANRIEEMERAMADAASLYPTQASLWYARFNIMIYSGRANAAIAMAHDIKGRPNGLKDSMLPEMLELAQAVDTREPAAIDKALAVSLRQARTAAAFAEYAIRDASILGRLDDAFALAEAYYFGRGFIIPDGPMRGSGFSPEQRDTRLLFEPVTRPMRADARFALLVKDIGLERYWRESGTQPDYRQMPA